MQNGKLVSKKNCALCSAKLTKENKSKEHIIPNAIGGRKKLANFICKECNERTGKEWDVELAKQLDFLSLFFNITRDRGKPQPYTFKSRNGKDIQLCNDGRLEYVRPTIEKCKNGNDTLYSITARNKTQARQVLKGISRNLPQIDIDNEIGKIRDIASYANVSELLPVNLQIGSEQAGKSTIKSMLALANSNHILPSECEEAVKYLTSPCGKSYYGYYYENDLVRNRKDGAPIHIVSVTGLPETKQLIGYMEYYGAFRFISRLSKNYQGDHFSRNYAINPITGETLNVEVDISFSEKDIKDIYEYKYFSEEKLKDALAKVLEYGYRANTSREIERVINDAVDEILMLHNISDNQVLTENEISLINRNVSIKVFEYIQNIKS